MKILCALLLMMNAFVGSAAEVFVQAGDAKLFCRTFGEGDPIIVIHGGPGLSQDYLLPYMARLGNTHQAIFYDQRACGLSTGEINEKTIQLKTFLDDIDSIRKSFRLEKITVLGHSWGGLIATLYASAYPEAVDKLILMATMPSSSEGYSSAEGEWIKRMTPYLNLSVNYFC